jgi:uncharacterized membrane protein
VAYKSDGSRLHEANARRAAVYTGPDAWNRMVKDEIALSQRDARRAPSLPKLVLFGHSLGSHRLRVPAMLSPSDSAYRVRGVEWSGPMAPGRL